MTPFPSPLERAVAAALLLLSTTDAAAPPPSPSLPSGGYGGQRKLTLSFKSSGSRSRSSSLTSDASSSAARIQSHNLRMVTVAARCHGVKLKVARRKRSNVSWTSSDRGGEADSFSGSASIEQGSCLSSTSFATPAAAASATRRSTNTRDKETTALLVQPENKPRKRQYGGSAHMRRVAEAIMKMLSNGFYSEVSIRQALGDSPDTSKALRMLLKKDAIKRSGTGGRSDPYIYTVA